MGDPRGVYGSRERKETISFAASRYTLYLESIIASFNIDYSPGRHAHYQQNREILMNIDQLFH